MALLRLLFGTGWRLYEIERLLSEQLGDETLAK
jgi:hypothetical protein